MEYAEGTLSPLRLVAITRQLTGLPLARPATTMGEEIPVLLDMPHVAVYALIATPPVCAGGVNCTLTEAFPAVAMPMIGASANAAAMLIENACAAGAPMLLFAVIMPEIFATTLLGIPLITPLLLSRLKPAGNAPLLTVNVGAGEPVAVNVNEYDWP